MAPSATETITVPQPVTSSLKAFATEGDYKEISAVSFSEETEKKGTDEHAAASVCTNSHNLRSAHLCINSHTWFAPANTFS